MRSSKPSTTARPTLAWCITAIAARSICRIRYTERLAEAGIEPSVGSRGDSYDNALAESVIGLFKTEVIRQAGPWRGLEDVEFATLEWVDWFNTRRLLEPLGYRAAGRVRGAVSPRLSGSGHRGRTHVTESPGNPGRFSLWLIHGVRKHDKSIYLACIGWIILDAAIVIGVIVRQ